MSQSCIICDTDRGVEARAVHLRHREELAVKPLCEDCSDQVNWKLTRHPTKREQPGVSDYIVRLKREGFSYRAIAKRLNDEGYRTLGGSLWSRPTVTKVFEREAPSSSFRHTRASRRKKLRKEPKPTVRYGFEVQNNTLVPKESEQVVVREILALREQGVSYEEIAKRLDQQGHRSPRGRGWNYVTVRNIWRRESNA